MERAISERTALAPRPSASAPGPLWDGCRDPSCICQAWFDLAYTDSLYRNCLSFLARHYFRAELIHPERIPVRSEADPPLIFAANHSGMAFPWDSLMLKQVLWPVYIERYGQAPPRRDHIRALAAPELSASRLMRLYGIDGWWYRMGTVDVSYENFETMMRHPWDLILFPEGTTGIGKGFNRRYQLVRFKKSLAKICLRHGATIVPVHVINAEFLNPLAYSSDHLNGWARKRGIPFIPIGPLTLGFLLFPFVFYSVCPAHLRYVIGEPIRLDPPAGVSRPTETDYRSLTDIVQRRMQEDLLRYARQYGERPYDLRSFVSEAWRQRRRLFDLVPVGWPRMFIRHARNHGGTSGSIWPYYAPLAGWLWAR